MTPIILRRRQVCEALGIGLTTLDKIRASDPSFPKPFKLVEDDARAIGWLAADVEAWAHQRAGLGAEANG